MRTSSVVLAGVKPPVAGLFSLLSDSCGLDVGDVDPALVVDDWSRPGVAVESGLKKDTSVELPLLLIAIARLVCCWG